MATTKKAPAKQSPAKSAAAGRTVPAKAAVARNGVAKKAASPKVTAKKAPAHPPAAKKAPVAKKVPVKKAAAPAKPPARVVSPPALARKATMKKMPPKRTGPLDKFLLGQLAALEEERVTYVRQAASLKAEADLLAAEREPGDVQFDEESGEGDTLAVERERDLALSAQAQAAVEEIDLALAKLRDGTYGVCEQCNGIIPKERLRALPHAALCVQCKSAGFSRR
jgi:RNA polymerase-binding transcription factor DksA